MDIRDVGARLEGPSRKDRVDSSRSGNPSSGKTEQTAAEDFFQNSGRLGRVRALIDTLVQVPEVRPEVVERARSLLAQGRLDTPEAATAAAEGFVEGV